MKRIKVLIAALAITTLITFPAFAEWKQEGDGRWWYQNDDGGYPANQWMEIDGKQYYFGEDGYMLTNTTTPDGKQVGEDGALIQDSYFLDGFENATINYEKFYSYASENGLGGTLVYIEGKVLNQTKIGDGYPPLFAIVVEQKDGKRWCVSINSYSEIEGIKGNNVRIFGTYRGFSDVMNLPAIGVENEDANLFAKVRVEAERDGAYETVWTFLDYILEEINNLG